MGQFLTGDIDLNHRYCDLKTHYKGLLDRIIVVQIPHHGAQKTWRKDILNDIPNCLFWVVSSGLSNRYGHPHLNVVSDIIKKGYVLSWSNELNQIMIKGEVKWY